MSKKRREQENISDIDNKAMTEEAKSEKTAENAEGETSKDQAPAESYERGMRLSIAWDEKGKNEIGNCVFNNSPDTLKKGEPFDLLILICALLALACLSVMLVSGINKGFTPSMWVLMGCYAFIAFICLCRPLHYAASKSAWNASLREKFPVNKGFSTELELFDDKISVTDALGRKEDVKLDEMAGIYETDRFFVFHENDSRIFAASKEKLARNEYAEEIKEILESKVKKCVSEEKKETAEVKAADDTAENTRKAEEDVTTETVTEEAAETTEATEEEDVNAVKVQSVTSFADKKRKELEELESLMKEDK